MLLRFSTTTSSAKHISFEKKTNLFYKSKNDLILIVTEKFMLYHGKSDCKIKENLNLQPCFSQIP